MIDIETILSKLRKVHRAGEGAWTACCPAHEDKNPSLSIKCVQGKILLKCHHGCDFVAICASLGVEPKELFEPSNHQKTNGSSSLGTPVADYVYEDVDLDTGKITPCMMVRRFAPKTFRQYHPAPGREDGWARGQKANGGNERDAKLVLFRLPQVLDAAAAGRLVLFVEGEKDVLNLEKLEFDATTTPGGAEKPWLPQYGEPLRGARVVVIADKDKPDPKKPEDKLGKGRRHAIHVCNMLQGIAESVKYIELPGEKVKDASDWIEQGGNRAGLVRLIQEAAEFDPENPPEPEIDDGFPQPKSAHDLCSDPEPIPPLLIEELLHEGLKMTVGGPSKAHKSWMFIQMGLSVAAGIEFLGLKTHEAPVLYVNFELKRPFATQRIKEVCQFLGIEWPKNFYELNLRDFEGGVQDIIRHIRKLCKKLGIKLLIIDPVYKLQDQDYDENSAAAVHNLLREVSRISIASNTAVVIGAHFAKGNAASKEQLDRVSGSGVFARDPDVFVTLTPQEEEDEEAGEGEGYFSFETTLRCLPPLKAFVVQWKCPIFERDDTRDPASLKQPKGAKKAVKEEKEKQVGRSKPGAGFLLGVLQSHLSPTISDPEKRVIKSSRLLELYEEAGYSKNTFKEVVDEALEMGEMCILDGFGSDRTKYYGTLEDIKAFEQWKIQQNAEEIVRKEMAKAGAKKAAKAKLKEPKNPMDE